MKFKIRCGIELDTYPAFLHKISAETSEGSELPVFLLKYVIDFESSTEVLVRLGTTSQEMHDISTITLMKRLFSKLLGGGFGLSKQLSGRMGRHESLHHLSVQKIWSYPKDHPASRPSWHWRTCVLASDLGVSQHSI